MLRGVMKRSGLRENIKLCVLGGYVQGFENTGTLFQRLRSNGGEFS